MSKTLLVVENEAALRDLYKRELEASGYKVNTARSGEEALYCLNHDSVDLIVIDIETQSKSDQNYLKEFLDINADMKVIINTSYPDFDEWSADAFVMKSSDLRELKNAVHDLLSQSGKLVEHLK